MSSGVHSPASIARITSLLNGTSSAFRIKPGLSCVSTGICPAASVQAQAVANVSSEVLMPRDISISFITCAGRQKCMPTIRSSRPVPPAISVIDRVEVLDAKIVLSLQMRFSAPNSSFFTARFSKIASITRSQSARSCSDVVSVIRPSAESQFSWLIRPFSTDRPKNFCAALRDRASPSADRSKQ